jgi:phage terminase large subunit-like protein
MGAPAYCTSCPDWESRIIEGRSLIPFAPLFPESAAEAREFRHRLKIVDVGDGEQTIGDIGATWAEDVANAIFGAYDPETGIQLIREAFVLISKKNAKSTEAASIMLTVLTLNWRQSAEFIILAPTKEVADNAYAPARDMVKADPQLDAMMQVQDHIRTIKHLGTGATLKVVAADTNTVGGKKAAVVLVDEIHLFGKNPHAAKMLVEATGGLASRPEGFVLYLTTQSDEPPAGVFASKLMYARKVRDGEIVDKNFLPILYEFPESYVKDKLYLDPANFHMTNPNLGKSASIAFIEREIRRAEAVGPEEMLIVLSKYLNIEVGLALRTDRWAGADFWLEQTDETLTFEQFRDKCEVICVGIDGGGLDDLLGLNVLGRLIDTDVWVSWSRAWAHPSALKRNLAEKSKMEDFAQQGDLGIVKRIGDDVTELCDLVEQVYEWGLLDKIGVDPVGIGAIFDELINRGIPEDKIVGISQGWKLGGAIKTAERRLAGGQLRHAKQPLMIWAVSNCRIEPRANSILVTKQASGSAKIDPVMALFNAVSLMSLNPAAAHKKYQIFTFG